MLDDLGDYLTLQRLMANGVYQKCNFIFPQQFKEKRISYNWKGLIHLVEFILVRLPILDMIAKGAHSSKY